MNSEFASRPYLAGGVGGEGKKRSKIGGDAVEENPLSLQDHALMKNKRQRLGDYVKPAEAQAAPSAKKTPEPVAERESLLTFPERLMELLDSGSESDCMWWLPDGTGFCVVPKPFAQKVLNLHFQGTKFQSFTRKLNRWGFKRAAGQNIPDHCIAYYSSSFQHGKPELLKNMSGANNKKSEASAARSSGSLPKCGVMGPTAEVSATAVEVVPSEVPKTVFVPAVQAPLGASSSNHELLAASSPIIPRTSPLLGGANLMPPHLVQQPSQLLSAAVVAPSTMNAMTALLAQQQQQVEMLQRAQLVAQLQQQQQQQQLLLQQQLYPAAIVGSNAAVISSPLLLTNNGIASNAAGIVTLTSLQQPQLGNANLLQALMAQRTNQL